MKVNKKKLIIHSIILLSMIIACCFDFQLVGALQETTYEYH